MKFLWVFNFSFMKKIMSWFALALFLVSYPQTGASDNPGKEENFTNPPFVFSTFPESPIEKKSAFSFSNAKGEDVTTKRGRLNPQPAFAVLDVNQQAILIKQANNGDKQAQDEVVERNYWGFIDKQFQSSLWGNSSMHSARINILPWENIEKRAIDDDRYAYALIHSYSYAVRWSRARLKPFLEEFSDLFKTIQAGALSGDPASQFNFGVIFSEFPGFPGGSFEWIQKAAAQGHSLSLSALGLLAERGRTDRQGRNDIEALRWYFASKNNKLSQEALQGNDLLTSQPYAPCTQGTFYHYIESVKMNLETLLSEHSIQIEFHNSNAENKFTIPGYSAHYQKITRVEKEALRFLDTLQATTPGFMITAVMAKERRDLASMVSRQTQPPYICVYEVNKPEYFTLGQQNVYISGQFLDYLRKIEKKFSKADILLKEDSASYLERRKKHLSKLKEMRLLCLHYQEVCKNNPTQINIDKLEKNTQDFNKQTKKYLVIEPILTKAFQKIKKERIILGEVMKKLQNLIHESIGIRNYEFFVEYPYLKK